MEVLDAKGTVTRRDLRWHWVALISLALIIVLAPDAYTFVNVVAPNLNEQRVLAPRPAFPKTAAELKTYPLRLDAYAQDNFPLRAKFIGWTNAVRYRLGYSGFPMTIVGRDGWLFFDDGSHLSYWRGARLTDPEVNAWTARLRDVIQSLHAKGIQVYFMYPPYKPTVYPEKLPFWMRVSRHTMLDQLTGRAQSAGLGDYIVDVRQPIISAKTPSQLLYFQLDSHWNSTGAYIAYRELMTRMQRDFPDLSPRPLADFPLTYWPSGDLAFMLGIGKIPTVGEHGENPTNWPTTEWLTESHDWSAPHVIHSKVDNGRTLLITRDSYASSMLPYLASNFQRIVVSAVRDGDLRKSLIEKYHPDVVVIESVEEYCSLVP